MDVNKKDTLKDLEQLDSEWREMRAEKKAKEEKAKRRYGNQKYVYSSSHPFWDAFLNKANEEYIRWQRNPVFFLQTHQEPVYVPVMVEPENAEMPEEIIALKTPRQYEHPFPVQAHLMNLGGGRKVSAEKLRTAEECGFMLREDGTQTWVKAYTKGENDP